MLMKVFDIYPSSDGYADDNDVIRAGQMALDLANLAKGCKIDTSTPIYKQHSKEISECAERAFDKQGGLLDGVASEMLSKAKALLGAFESGNLSEIQAATDAFYKASDTCSPLKNI